MILVLGHFTMQRSYQGLFSVLTATALIGSLSSSAMALPAFVSSLDAQRRSPQFTIAQDNLPTVTPSPSSTSEPNSTGTTTAATQSRFGCQLVNGQQTVMYFPESQPSLGYAWAIPQTMGGGWSTERRCAEISRRLEEYRPDGLIELQTSQENGYNTVCATTQQKSGCRIVFTVPQGQDPALTRDRVFQNLTLADSGQQTQGVSTFTERGNSDPLLRDLSKLGDAVLGGRNRGVKRAQLVDDGIDLRPFLDRADGGTGAKLKGGVAIKR
jgi:Circadian oscillating protein COP23